MSGRDTPLDPYTDPETGVLRNLLAIREPEILEQAETELSFAKIIWLADNPLPGGYDLEHLQAFHRTIFADIYDWAGEIRTVGISRTEPFCLPPNIVSYGRDVFQGLRSESHLRQLSRPRFVERLAHYLGEVNALHPFREGNGRAQRAFFGQLAREAGWRLRWPELSPAENDAACRDSLRGNFEPLQALLDRIIAPG